MSKSVLIAGDFQGVHSLASCGQLEKSIMMWLTQSLQLNHGTRNQQLLRDEYINTLSLCREACLHIGILLDLAHGKYQLSQK